MTPENIEAIQDALAPVADKIGQGAEYGWEVLVMGQFAEGVAMLGAGLLGVVASALVVRWGKNRYAEDDMDIGAVFAMTFGCVAVLFFGAAVYNGLIMVIAPEYAALKFLISLGN
jgi:hypothetical protein